MSLVVDQYSGVVVNQNQRPAEVSDFITVTDGLWRYQEVFLPSDYVRGTQAGHQIIPPLSGWQLLVGVDAGVQTTASLEWIAQYRIFGIGWVTLAFGVTTGIQAEGNQVWMDMPFDNPVDLSFEQIDERMRFGFRNISGVNKVWYSNPNPLALQGFAKLYAANGTTAIQDTGSDVSVLFRVLALIADNGTDFLGNPYRSAIRSNVSDNTNTVDGSKIDSIYLSEPAPSRFAVKSLYYDIRQPTPIRYGKINRITNPSFELGTAGWSAASGSVISKVTTWANTGIASMLVVNSGSQTAGGATFTSFPVITGRTYAGTIAFNITSSLSNGVRISIGWYDLSNALLSTSTGLFSTGTGLKNPSLVAIAPANAQTGRLVIETTGTSGSFSFMVDSAIVVEDTAIPQYFDGDTPGYRWSRDPHNSSSVEVIEGTVTDDQAVVDNVLIDPVTPGVWFSIYYSSEGDRPETEEEWETKMWTRVPGSFRALKRESHKLPQPILAKYIKIEFTHLQARSYNPGDFAKPIRYKKHPKWVLDYFLARVGNEQQLANKLASNRVAVIYDAMDIAYNYYLDDLRQEPDQPVEVDPNYTSTVTSFLSDRTDLSDVVDATVLERINLSLQPYRDRPGTFTKNNYLPSTISQAITTDLDDYPVERNSVARDDVSMLRNLEVVQENDYPVMFFYLTCRHKYREVVAPFSYDRAYFVGVREIAFTRERYTVAFDNDQYIEPAGDLFNTERNDFTE